MLNKNLWLAASIPTLCVLALLGWAYSYYGYALPNTFYAKIPGDQSMTWLGKRYLRKYLELHHYIPAYLLGLALVMLLCKLSVPWAARWVTRENSQSQSAIPNAQSRTPNHYHFLPLLASIAIWLCYLIYIGGDFMEFRLLVPILPMFAVVVFGVMSLMGKKKITYLVSLVTIFSLCYSNYNHLIHSGRNMGVIASTKFLNYYVIRKDSNWREIGLALNTLFPGFDVDNPIILASFPAGLIPYYSGLKTIDVYGLNYRALYTDISLQNPSRKLRIPGHQVLGNNKLISLENTHLNIYHPQPLCKNRTGKYTRADRGWPYFPFRRHRTILLPINTSCYLVADYITPHPRVEELLASGVILDYKQNREKFSCPKWLCLD